MNNFITEDTQWLQAKASAESNTLQTRYARDAARFDGVEADPVIRRKLEILKRAITLPSPTRAGAAQELATINSRLEAAYSTGKFSHKGKEIALDDAEEILRTSRDPDGAEGDLGGLAQHRAADAARLLHDGGDRQRRRARARLRRHRRRSGAPGTTWRPTPSRRRSTRCGSRSSRSTTICTATCAAG